MNVKDKETPLNRYTPYCPTGHGPSSAEWWSVPLATCCFALTRTTYHDETHRGTLSPAPQATDNRVIIPKIGVNIPYDKGAASLDRGAEWRYPERGNPEKGGNFIIAAHRFSIQPTPQGTIEKSPFYHIDKLAVGDKIVIDYIGTRYGYEIEKIFTVKPTQVEIEAPSTDAKLTLYTCELDGSDAGRVVVVAKPLGKVAL